LISLFELLLQSQLTMVDQMRGANISNLAAMEQTRMLANTLAQNDDPKFQVYMLYHYINISHKFLTLCAFFWGLDDYGECHINELWIKGCSSG
jgi:hypothetical protein